MAPHLDFLFSSYCPLAWAAARKIASVGALDYTEYNLWQLAEAEVSQAPAHIRLAIDEIQGPEGVDDLVGLFFVNGEPTAEGLWLGPLEDRLRSAGVEIDAQRIQRHWVASEAKEAALKTRRTSPRISIAPMDLASLLPEIEAAYCLYPSVVKQQAQDDDYAFAQRLKHDLLLQITKDRGTCACLARDGEHVAGMVTFFPKDLVPRLGRVISSEGAFPPEHILYVACLLVRLDYKRRGVGSSLIAAVLKHAQEADFREVEVAAFSPPWPSGAEWPWQPIPLYSKMGFSVKESRKRKKDSVFSFKYGTTNVEGQVLGDQVHFMSYRVQP